MKLLLITLQQKKIIYIRADLILVRIKIIHLLLRAKFSQYQFFQLIISLVGNYTGVAKEPHKGGGGGGG